MVTHHRTDERREEKGQDIVVGRPVALVGCGAWGQYILRDLISLGCKVTVVEPSALSQARARAGAAYRIVPDIPSLPDVDGIVVATPINTHAVVVESLLDRGVPLFVEKPLCTSRATAERLLQRAGDRIFVMDKWRYHAGVRLLRDLARSGDLGPVIGLRTFRVQWGNAQSDIDTSWQLAPHDLAVALEIFGQLPPPRFGAAEAVGSNCKSLIGILGDEPWVIFEVSSRYNRRRRELRLHCLHGVAVLDDAYSTHVSLFRADPDLPGTAVEEQRSIPAEMPLLKELAAFVDYLDGGSPPRSTAADGVAIVAAIETLRTLAGIPPS